jgi:regulator of sigma E protease
MIHLLHTLLSFVAVLSTVVFIHEFGHYFIAKLCGVKVEAFSIGFGKELVGWNDRSGTRWKLALLPLGGYVKMYGDASAASTADEDLLAAMTPEERAQAFHFKPLWQKAAVVVAGPSANFLLTIALFTYFIMTTGLPTTDPVVGEVLPDSPAASAGLQSGDRIVSVGGRAVRRFADIPFYLSTNTGTPVEILFRRNGEPQSVTMTPKSVEDEDGLGNKIHRPLIGIRSKEMKYEDVGLPRALAESVSRTYQLCVSTFEVMGQIVRGERGVRELKGPVGIAQLSGQATEKGISTTLWLIAMISANLGLVNLFPIPVLDGGHLAYYAAQGLRGRPLAQKVQEWGFRVGFALIAMLMAFTIFNDVRNLVM